MTLKIQRLLASAKKNIRKGNIEAAKDDYLTVLKSLPNNQEAKNQLLKLSQNILLSDTITIRSDYKIIFLWSNSRCS